MGKQGHGLPREKNYSHFISCLFNEPVAFSAVFHIVFFGIIWISVACIHSNENDGRIVFPHAGCFFFQTRKTAPLFYIHATLSHDLYSCGRFIWPGRILYMEGKKSEITDMFSSYIYHETHEYKTGFFYS
jgi:hypothetical protein